jgi:uncharacterized protein YuzE
MKLSYDPRYNIAYISLRNKTEEVQTLRISDELHIDIAPDGKIYGIELLNANQQLKQDNNVTVINEALGKSQQIPLQW